MLEVVKSQKVKENEIKKIKKEFSISPKIIRNALLTGVGAELLALTNHGYNFYKSGVGMPLRLPYCSGMIIPYWFIALAILSPATPYFVKGFKKISGAVKSENKDDLTNMWGKYYGDGK